TAAGRTLDVTATGEAGIDWANIGSPTTVQGLSGTTIKTATDVATAVATLPTLAQILGAVVDSSAPANAQTLAQILNLIVSAVIAKLTNVSGTVTIRNTGNTKDRIVGTVDDNGNRTALTTADGT